MSLLTSGANGEIIFWDMVSKEDLGSIKTNKDITCIRPNGDGTLMAYAIGYSWSQGIWGLKDLNYAPEIYVKILKTSNLTNR